MCGRYSLTASREALESRFDVAFPEHEPRYNCAPGQTLPFISAADPDAATRGEWGFTPTWADDEFGQINARAETVREKTAFRDAFETRRCVVPADGFYEWTETDGRKRPHRVAFRDDRPFLMAGIHARWEDPDAAAQSGLDAFGGGATGDALSAESTPAETFAVVTTEPNDLVAELHHRMAVVLDPEDVETYLHGSTDEAAATLRTYPGDDLRSYPVSTRVNDPANDDPTLVEPV